MIEFDRFIDRSRPGRTITQGGFTSHAQAGARMEGECVVFLLLQGRQLDVRAHEARFLEGKLSHYRPLPGGDVYLTTSTALPSGAGVEMALVHRALVPDRLPDGATHLFTFGPPHFGRMFRAAAPVPPQGESVLWEMGQEAGLILELRDTWNVRLWLVRLDAERWRQVLATCPHLPSRERGSLPDDASEPGVRDD
jgi:hypothetical protein